MKAWLVSLVLTGCVSSTPVVTTSASVAEPEGKSCLNASTCGSASCVKPKDAPTGVCSQDPSTPACRKTADCAPGTYCYRQVGFNGVCFRP